MKLTNFTFGIKSILMRIIEKKIHIEIRNKEVYSLQGYSHFTIRVECSICNTVSNKVVEIRGTKNERTSSKHKEDCIVKKYIEVYNLIKNHETIKPDKTVNQY